MTSVLGETEDGFMGWIRDYARYRQWLTFHPLRSKGSEPGWPDLSLCRPPTLILAELKTDVGRLTADQRVWLEALERCNRLEVHLWRPRHRPEVERMLW